MARYGAGRRSNGHVPLNLTRLRTRTTLLTDTDAHGSLIYRFDDERVSKFWTTSESGPCELTLKSGLSCSAVYLLCK